MKKYLIIFTIAATLSACNTQNKAEQNDHAKHESHDGHDHDGHDHAGHGNPRSAELMAVHDSMMTQMSTIYNLQKQLKVRVKTLDSLVALKPDPAYKLQIAKAQTLIKQLETTDAAMMNWMHQYKADTLEKLDDKQTDAYIADQNAKIQVVREKMETGISEAQAFLKNGNPGGM